MMGLIKSSENAAMESLYPSLDITLGSMEPSFIAWEDEKEVSSFQETRTSSEKDYLTGGNSNASMNQKSLLTHEEDGHLVTRLSLKEQERMITDLKKENFGLKMRVYFLDERLSQTAPENMEKILKENIEQKVENESLHVELDNTKRILQESKKAMDHLRKAAEAVDQSTAQKEEVIRAHEAKQYQDTITNLEEKLQIRENELRFTRVDIDTMEGLNSELNERLNLVERDLQEKDDYMEYLKQHMAEEMTHQLNEKEDEMTDLKSKLEEYEDLIEQLKENVVQRDNDLLLVRENQKNLLMTIETFKEEKTQDNRDELIQQLHEDIETQRQSEESLKGRQIQLEEELREKNLKLTRLLDLEMKYEQTNENLEDALANYADLETKFDLAVENRENLEVRLRNAEMQLEDYSHMKQGLLDQIHDLEETLKRVRSSDQDTTTTLKEQLITSLKFCQEKEASLIEVDRKRRDLEDRLTLSGERLESCLQELTRKTELIHQLEREKASTEERLPELTDRITILTSEVRSKHQQVQDFKVQFEQLHEKLRQSEGNLKERDTAVIQLRHELEETHASLVDMDRKASILEAQLDEMRRKSDQDLNDFKKLKDQEISRLHDILKSFEKGHQDENLKVNELCQKLAQKDEELFQLRSLSYVAESRLKEIQSLNAALENAQTRLLEFERMQNLQLTSAPKKEELQHLQNEVIENDRQIAQLERDIDRYRIFNEDTTTEIQKLKELLNQKQTELTKVHDELDRKTKELLQSRSDLFTKNVEIARLREFSETSKYKDEEILRLNEILKSSLDALKTVEFNVSSSHAATNHRITSEADSVSRIPLLIDQIRSLSSQLEAANARNDKLHDLLLHNIRTLEDAHLAAIRDYVQRIENLASNNDHFRNDIMERTRELEESRFETRTLQHENSSLIRDVHRLKKRLSKREGLISKALQRLEHIHQLQQESHLNDDSVYRRLEGVGTMIRTNGIISTEPSKRETSRFYPEPSSAFNWRIDESQPSTGD